MICPKCGHEMVEEVNLAYIPTFDMEKMEAKNGTPWICRNCNSHFVQEFTYDLVLKKEELWEGLPKEL
jgi:transposase-like protein